MTKAKRDPEKIFMHFLRQNLTDVNSSRSGQWIFDDYPRTINLGNNQFPRVAITLISEESDRLGIFDDNSIYTVMLQVDCVAKKDQKFTKTVTDEAVGTMSSAVNSNRLVLEFVPNAVTNIQHDGTPFGTVTVKTRDSDFTAPGSLGAGTVEYSLQTGNLNFSSADVTSYDGEAITSTYTVILADKKLVKYLAREIIKLVKNNWRTDTTLNGLFYPELLNKTSIPFEEENGIFRESMDYRVKGFNLGEGI